MCLKLLLHSFEKKQKVKKKKNYQNEKSYFHFEKHTYKSLKYIIRNNYDLPKQPS